MLYTILIILTLIISAALGMFMIPQILRYCLRHEQYDRIDERKIHNTRVPRLGGVAFLPSLIISFLVALVAYNLTETSIQISLWTLGVVLGMTIVYATGLVDDFMELPAMLKFLAQGIAAVILPLSGLYINNLYGLFGIHEISFWVSFPLTILLVTFVNNVINLIDGIDGLSASLCIIALVGFGAIFLWWNMWVYAALVAGMIGVLVSFLYYNLFGSVERGTKLFMGDSGSLLLGYVLSFFALKCAVCNTIVIPYHDYGLLLPFTLLLVPCLDACRIIIVRLSQRRSIFSPDRQHIHHLLMAAGLSQHKALAVLIALQLAACGLNYCLYALSTGCNIIIGIDIVLYFAFAHAVKLLKR